MQKTHVAAIHRLSGAWGALTERHEHPPPDLPGSERLRGSRVPGTLEAKASPWCELHDFTRLVYLGPNGRCPGMNPRRTVSRLTTDSATRTISTGCARSNPW